MPGTEPPGALTTPTETAPAGEIGQRPFRFGLHFWELPAGDWRARVHRYEQLGFSSLTLTDHLVVPQWEPLTGLGAVAAASRQLRVGTLVLDMGLRDPVLTAKAAATLQLLSGDRLELGVGAGYVAANFAAAGLPFAPAGDRVARLAEALELMRRLWSAPSTTFSGRYFHVTESPMAAAQPVRPYLLVGGGGPRMMRLGGQVADTVSMLPRQTSGTWSVADSLADATVERMAQKAAWVREGAAAAGRDPGQVELHTMVVRVAVGDGAGAAWARATAEDGVDPDRAAGTTLYLSGTGPQVRDTLQRWRDEAGITYVSFFDPGDEQIARLADEVVGPLATPT